jgi:hypothetical protein
MQLDANSIFSVNSFCALLKASFAAALGIGSEFLGAVMLLERLGLVMGV